uniref:NADP-dependent oxidoreductase domain-containing protein n=1 Tax=Chromera velia CCMP2878 TaxID=1169474 RepID=A0A0G4I600_9ALVE|eukprot:Cvel_11273.t1-p1 / transcript=Cvel_11273.t1 / gene=Cvel_11273 / organism=Chromera_velia_CCMP2878 / gene_product=Pyridoxal reductase, chloroplastic, putative / transcript_product=Pyridoxal reductase, chloroplastic, putative / location=Cvel_scaffold703:10727-11758(-) / protein_length=344 / sequence_SO=supercontig / SO=protein_coding / is_pseudo=false
MLWGNTWLDKKVNGRLLSAEEVGAIVSRAVEAGITFFDTAEGYGGGSSEEMLAVGVAGLSAEASRSLILASKFLPTLWRWTERSFIRALEESNKRLGISCSPLFFIHSPMHPRALEVWVHAAGQAYRSRKLEALGLSNFNAEQVRRAVRVAAEYGLRIKANQILLNLLVFQSRALQETLEVCKSHQITVVAYSPIAQGLLADGLTEEKSKKIRMTLMTGVSFETLQPLRRTLQSIAEKYQCSMAQVSLRWVMCKGAVALVGTRSVTQLEDSLKSVQVHLTEDDVEALDEVSMGRHTFEKPIWRRSLFVIFISILVSAYRLNRFLEDLFRWPQRVLFGRGHGKTL